MGVKPAYGSLSLVSGSSIKALGSTSAGIADIAVSKSLPVRPDNSKYLAADLPVRLPLLAESM